MAAPSAEAGKPTYSAGAYWDTRYTGPAKNFDWFFNYPALKELLQKYLPSGKVLHVGCGNSNIQEGMAADGFIVTNVDISPVVIEQMKHQHAENHSLDYIVADCRDMSELATGSFQSCIDKGTLDAVLCSQSGQGDAVKYLHEIGRLLQPGGTFLLISLGAPAARVALLQKELWGTCEVLLLPKPLLYMQSDSTLTGRPLPAGCPADKNVPILPVGPWRADLVGEELEAQHLDTRDYFFAYVCTKPPSLEQQEQPQQPQKEQQPQVQSPQPAPGSEPQPSIVPGQLSGGVCTNLPQPGPEGSYVGVEPVSVGCIQPQPAPRDRTGEAHVGPEGAVTFSIVSAGAPGVVGAGTPLGVGDEAEAAVGGVAPGVVGCGPSGAASAAPSPEPSIAVDSKAKGQDAGPEGPAPGGPSAAEEAREQAWPGNVAGQGLAEGECVCDKPEQVCACIVPGDREKLSTEKVQAGAVTVEVPVIALEAVAGAAVGDVLQPAVRVAQQQ